ncbi:unnamed protein product [Microthlaspi erraticum]|uniref:Uncharacterized protein n=1 Tax=Microthlaspi erraticum TaxID=1685480 RepID=A0A6D2IW00_9BRAS|nr:unnamed protein product [Microthlaspi erraticum]
MDRVSIHEESIGRVIVSDCCSAWGCAFTSPAGSFGAFWSIWDVGAWRTWCMDAAQLDTQRKKEEAILKTSSTTYSTNRSSSSTRPAKLQLDRAEKSKSNPKNVASPLTSFDPKPNPLVFKG